MERRYFPRKPGKRLESVVYKESRQKKNVFSTPNQPYDESFSKSRSKTRKKYREYRKKEVFPAPHKGHSKSGSSKSGSSKSGSSKSRKKREKLHKLRNLHGQNKINYNNFWQ